MCRVISKVRIAIFVDSSSVYIKLIVLSEVQRMC